MKLALGLLGNAFHTRRQQCWSSPYYWVSDQFCSRELNAQNHSDPNLNKIFALLAVLASIAPTPLAFYLLSLGDTDQGHILLATWGLGTSDWHAKMNAGWSYTSRKKKKQISSNPRFFIPYPESVIWREEIHSAQVIGRIGWIPSLERNTAWFGEKENILLRSSVEMD